MISKSRIRIAVIHYQPLEQYPPAMNMLNVLSAKKQFEVYACTLERVKGPGAFNPAGITIKRFGRLTGNSLFRYMNYLRFNISTFFYLLKIDPDFIIAYDTLSVMPVSWLKKIRKEVKILMHYHEYVSLPEYATASSYVKMLRRIEMKLMPEAIWVSQTNRERLQLFIQDNNSILIRRPEMMPNYPPRSFYDHGVATSHGSIKRFVYCGVLGLHNMFFNEFVKFIEDQKGKATCDFYIANCSPEVKKYFAETSNVYISLKQEVYYFDLPDILKNYDIGVVLHRGNTPNYIYNVPNKIYEYLAAGLVVWCSYELISAVRFKEEHHVESLRLVDFTKLQDPGCLLDKRTTHDMANHFIAENEYDRLAGFISQNRSVEIDPAHE